MRIKESCVIPGCVRSSSAQGLCGAHYQKWKKGTMPWDMKPYLTLENTPQCLFENCDKPAHSKGYCSAHSLQFQSGKELKPLRRHGEGSINKGGYRQFGRKKEFEHRLVMEKIVGRKLLAEESVHHKNGDRLDNRPENLELWNNSRHLYGQRIEDLVEYARHILKLYDRK